MSCSRAMWRIGTLHVQVWRLKCYQILSGGSVGGRFADLRLLDWEKWGSSFLSRLHHRGFRRLWSPWIFQSCTHCHSLLCVYCFGGLCRDVVLEFRSRLGVLRWARQDRTKHSLQAFGEGGILSFFTLWPWWLILVWMPMRAIPLGCPYRCPRRREFLLGIALIG